MLEPKSVGRSFSASWAWNEYICLTLLLNYSEPVNWLQCFNLFKLASYSCPWGLGMGLGMSQSLWIQIIELWTYSGKRLFCCACSDPEISQWQRLQVRTSKVSNNANINIVNFCFLKMWSFKRNNESHKTGIWKQFLLHLPTILTPCHRCFWESCT